MSEGTLHALLYEVRDFLADDAIIYAAGGTAGHDLTSALGTAGLPHHAGPAEDSADTWLSAALDLKRASGDREVLAISAQAGTIPTGDSARAAAENAVALVVLALRAKGTGEGAQLNESGWHVQDVAEFEEIQTALAAAFASGLPAAIFCDVPS